MEKSKRNDNVALFIITFFYAGFLSKKAPGTIGSAIATIVCLFLLKTNCCFLGVAGSVFILGITFCHVYLTKKDERSDLDPSYIVIDEASGIFLGASLLQLFDKLTWQALLINFILFRLFDIWKPIPIRTIEKICKKNLKTASFGIMLDDILAAMYATSLELILISSQ